MDMQIETSTTNNKPTFTIYQANGKRKTGLKKAFVEVIRLAYNKPTIKLADGSVWPVYYESQAPILGAKYIVSFQVYNDGSFFAVARLYKDKSNTKLTTDNYGNAT